MNNIRTEVAHWVQVMAVVAIWALVNRISNGRILPADALWNLPDVVFWYGALYLVFTKWLWRAPIFQGWLIPLPDLQGTWTGTLKSNWIDPATNSAVAPIPCSIVIRQSFAGISVAVHTKESSSRSIAASIDCDEMHGSKTVCYLYSNRSKVTIRDRSAVHEGAAMLEVLSDLPRSLVGEYWTGRGTKGEINVVFRDRRLDDRFVN